MTKKHFEKLAEMIRSRIESAEDHGDYVSQVMGANMAQIAGEVAEVCMSCNPLFDKARFLKACGVL